jgi:hypothetical protein
VGVVWCELGVHSRLRKIDAKTVRGRPSPTRLAQRQMTERGGPCTLQSSSSPTPELQHRPTAAPPLHLPLTMASLDPPTYLTSIQNNIRARPISWEGAVRAKTITDADLKKIKSIDKVRKEQRKQTIEADVDGFVALLVGGDGSQSIFEAAAKRQDIIHYMLVLLGDMIDGTSAAMPLPTT